MTVADTLDRFRNPEYTGENRCTPCTVVNTGIAVALAALAAVVWFPAGVVVLAVSLLLIGLRGYLVPGTPTLTKRYLPDRVLRYFEHGSPVEADERTDLDVESFLVDREILVPCRAGEDLCLRSDVEERWWDHVQRYRDAVEDAPLQELLADASFLDEVDDLHVESFGDARVAVADGVHVGRWESRAAYLADAAAAATLADEVDVWSQLDFRARTDVLGALRLWVPRCPSCEGSVTLGRETVESCCRSLDVVAAECDDCGSRLFEAEYDESMVAS